MSETSEKTSKLKSAVTRAHERDLVEFLVPSRSVSVPKASHSANKAKAQGLRQFNQTYLSE
jgi:hypothetical protein